MQQVQQKQILNLTVTKVCAMPSREYPTPAKWRPRRGEANGSWADPDAWVFVFAYLVSLSVF